MIRHLELKAYGKINLGLDVVRRREDGYHEVRMIMQTVRVYDAIELNRTEEEGTVFQRTFIICRTMKITWVTARRSF